MEFGWRPSLLFISLHSPELLWIRSRKEARRLMDFGWSYENFCLNNCKMHGCVLLLRSENAKIEAKVTRWPHRKSSASVNRLLRLYQWIKSPRKVSAFPGAFPVFRSLIPFGWSSPDVTEADIVYHICTLENKKPLRYPQSAYFPVHIWTRLQFIPPSGSERPPHGSFTQVSSFL